MKNKNKYSKKHIREVEKRLRFYEKVMSGETTTWEPCNICTSTGKTTNCENCLFFDSTSGKPCLSQARSRIRLDMELYEDFTNIKRLAETRYMELLQKIDINGYEYK